MPSALSFRDFEAQGSGLRMHDFRHPCLQSFADAVLRSGSPEAKVVVWGLLGSYKGNYRCRYGYLPPAHHRLRHTASADGDCYNDQDDIKKSIFMLRVLLL